MISADIKNISLTNHYGTLVPPPYPTSATSCWSNPCYTTSTQPLFLRGHLFCLLDYCKTSLYLICLLNPTRSTIFALIRKQKTRVSGPALRQLNIQKPFLRTFFNAPTYPLVTSTPHTQHGLSRID